MIDPAGVGASCWCTRLPHSLSLWCVFFFETVRTFLVRKVGDGMPFVTDVGEKKKIRDCRVCVVVCLQDE